MSTPLAERMRPRTFDEFVGQEEIVGEGRLLRKLIENDELSSLIFWGPPGVGKTTLAQIIAEQTKSRFVSLSGVMSGKEDLRRVIEEAQKFPLEGDGGGVRPLLGQPLVNNEPSPQPHTPREPAYRTGRPPSPFDSAQGDLEAQSKRSRGDIRRTILFIDEIHRWNKAQQDALLPYVEKGVVTLIGATTENPSFEIIGALLSRSRVFILKYLTTENIVSLLKRALTDKNKGLGDYEIKIEEESLELLAELAGGDARVALNALEMAAKSKVKSSKLKVVIDNADVKEALQRTHLVFDKKGEEFYNAISALHKSMRGSDANASLYWLARMLEGGADPLYIARRVLRFASEDIGMANSEALIQASAAFDAVHKIGMPECTVHLAQAVVYCAKSAKSNLLYVAYQRAAADAKATSHLGVPIHLRNAPTKFMKEIGYGKDYKYNPDYEREVEQDYLPPELKSRNYFGK